MYCVMKILFSVCVHCMSLHECVVCDFWAYSFPYHCFRYVSILRDIMFLYNLCHFISGAVS